MADLTEKQLDNFARFLEAVRDELLIRLAISSASGAMVELDQTELG